MNLEKPEFEFFDIEEEVEEVVAVEEECFPRLVNVKRLNIRTQPTKNAEILYKAVLDEELQICEFMDDGEWARVHNAAGVEGFAMTQFLDPPSIRS